MESDRSRDTRPSDERRKGYWSSRTSRQPILSLSMYAIFGRSAKECQSPCGTRLNGPDLLAHPVAPRCLCDILRLWYTFRADCLLLLSACLGPPHGAGPGVHRTGRFSANDPLARDPSWRGPQRTRGRHHGQKR
jgi:hypothetical protein